MEVSEPGTAAGSLDGAIWVRVEYPRAAVSGQCKLVYIVYLTPPVRRDARTEKHPLMQEDAQMLDWHEQLRVARESAGMSRREVAVTSRLSADSLRSYELGRRRPTREHLLHVLQCIKVDQATRNRILAGAGFAIETPIDRFPEPNVSTKEAVKMARERPWPAFLVDSKLEILALSAPAWRLLGQFDRDLPARRSVLTVITRREVRTRVQNLTPILSLVVQFFKHGVPHESSLERPGPYLSRILQQLVGGDPALVAKFSELWAATPPFQTRITGTVYPCVWNSDVGTMRFNGLITCLNAAEGLYCHNWIPADAQSHLLLEKLLADSSNP